MDTVTVSRYSKAWPSHFAAVRDELREVFAGTDACIEHIGSTAVPGLAAKPVLDLMVGASSLAGIESRIPALEALGWTYVSKHEAELPMRRYLTRPGPPMRTHLHGVVRGGELWASHLAFRDLLRSNPQVRMHYQALKQRLAREHANDKAAYTAAKDPFIRRALAGGFASVDARRAKLKAWKNDQAAAARARLPLPDAQMARFFRALQSRLETCHHDHRASTAVLHGMGLAPAAVATVLGWCADNGGYCDCEVILNAEGRWRECRAEP